MITDETKKMLALAIDLDPALLAKATDILLDSNAELDNDPDYHKWLDQRAMEFDASHARMPCDSI